MSSHQAGTEPLLPQHKQQNTSQDDAAAGLLGRCIMWITVVVLSALNCTMAANWYADQQSFMVYYSSLSLLALIACLKRYKKAEPGSQLRNLLKVAVWLLAIAFALLFSYMVVTVAPPGVAVVGCLMVVAAVAQVLYYFSSAI